MATFSTANGVTYAVAAQAPDGHLGTAQPIGSSTRFKQTQSYIKLTSDATLSFTLSGLSINIEDFNPSSQDEELILIEGETVLSVKAYLNQSLGVNFYRLPALRRWPAMAGSGLLWLRVTACSGAASGPWRISRSSPQRSHSNRPGSAYLHRNGGIAGTHNASHVQSGPVLRGRRRGVHARGQHLCADQQPQGWRVEVECQRSYAHAFLRDPLNVGGIRRWSSPD